MKCSLASLACFATAVVASQPSALIIDTPSNVVECEPTLITWNGGQPPYFLEVVPGTDLIGAPIEFLGEQTGHSLSWVANLAAGTCIGFILKDSTGNLAQTAPVTIEPGASTACLTA